LSEDNKEAGTFFEKKVPKKTFAPGGVWLGIAFKPLLRRGLKAIPSQTPPGAKVFCAAPAEGLFFKKALLAL
jgi:hypothetical protein